MKRKVVVGKQKCGCYLVREYEIHGDHVLTHDYSDGSGCGKAVDYGEEEVSLEEIDALRSRMGWSRIECIERMYTF